MPNSVTPPSRSGVFVSHANPEDNEFATWLTLQLTQAGYTVWCDVARLHGGEDFWRNIEEQIRGNATKFLFALSRTSNTKQGTLKELRVAAITATQFAIRDFIIPLKIDDIPYGDMNIELARLNAIPFAPNWAEGLSSLLAKLEEDRVPRNPEAGASAVSAWWKSYRPANDGVFSEQEAHLSNWLAVEPLPDTILFHEIARTGPGPTLLEGEVSIPTVPHNNYLVAFLEASSVGEALSPDYRIARTVEVSFREFAGDSPSFANISRRQRSDLVVALLRKSWEHYLEKHGFRRHLLAADRSCFYLAHHEGVTDQLPYRKADGTEGRKGLTGFKTVGGPSPDAKRTRYWHFGISARAMLHPMLGLVLYPHVLFSDDGRTIWTSPEKLHFARRSQCRWWFNAEWRNRILAFLYHAARGEDAIRLSGEPALVTVRPEPIAFRSPVGYRLAPDTTTPYEDNGDQADESFGDDEEGEASGIEDAARE